MHLWEAGDVVRPTPNPWIRLDLWVNIRLVPNFIVISNKDIFKFTYLIRA